MKDKSFKLGFVAYCRRPATIFSQTASIFKEREFSLCESLWLRTMDDKAIITLLNNRSEDSLTALQEKYGHYLYKVAYNILASQQDSEECVNDTYLRTWNTIPPQSPTVLRAFLARITRNLSIDMLRRRGRGKRGGGQYEEVLDELCDTLPSDSTVENAVELRAISDVINKFLYSLSQRERMIFIARYWHIESIPSISRDFELSNGKIKSILSQERKELAVLLTKEGINL